MPALFRCLVPMQRPTRPAQPPAQRDGENLLQGVFCPQIRPLSAIVPRMNPSSAYRFPSPSGWQTARIQTAADGRIGVLLPEPDARGFALPGIPNTHSHAFQRAMAGLAEHQTDPADSF